MTRRKIDVTLIGYLRNTANVLLTVLLGLAVAGFLGIETTSFAAFIAAFGLAVGAAWSGMLANFAAGAFLVVLRSFKSSRHSAPAASLGQTSRSSLRCMPNTPLSMDNWAM